MTDRTTWVSLSFYSWWGLLVCKRLRSYCAVPQKQLEEGELVHLALLLDSELHP